MAEYTSPVPVGDPLSNTFFPKYAPVTGFIGTDPYGWTFRSGYVAPFRSFQQQLINANYSLGPYCRAEGGLSGRIVTSRTGNLGFVQQCWYDYPRGPLDTDQNGNLYPKNREWWGECTKTTIIVKNLMVTGNPPITVQVAIGNYSTNSPQKFMFYEQVGFFLTRVINVAAYALLGGDCGVGTRSPYPDPSDSGGIFEDISGLINGVVGSIWNGFNGGIISPIGKAIIDSFSEASNGPFSSGGPLHPDNLGATFNNLIGDNLTKFGNFMDNLSEWSLFLLDENLEVRTESLKQAGLIIGAVPEAADLFVNGWFLRNIDFIKNPNAPGSAKENAYIWRPLDGTQQRFAKYMADNLNETDGIYINGTPRSTPFNSETGQKDWAWFLTLLNRSITGGVENAGKAYVDQRTNELVIPEVYGFSRGGSISTTNEFLNGVESTFNKQVADSLGVFLDMSPGSAFFVATVIPIFTLEAVGQAIKVEKGEALGPTNLDAYQNTYFETRITAKNVREGNTILYNNLVNSGQMREVQ